MADHKPSDDRVRIFGFPPFLLLAGNKSVVQLPSKPIAKIEAGRISFSMKTQSIDGHYLFY